jgi:glycosyltransferase involved in cell wall biosynthesis
VPAESSALRVGIDVRPAELARVGGTSTYVEQLVRALRRVRPDWHLVLLAGSADAPNRLQDLAEAHGVTWATTQRRQQTARIQLEVPKLLTRHGVDVFHSPGSFVPLAWRGPMVLTVHDLNVLTRPRDWASPREAARWLEMAVNLPGALLRPDYLLVGSEHVGSRLRRLLRSRAGRVRVQHYGPGRWSGPGGPSGTSGALAARSGPYILHVGEVARRKNLELLLRSFAEADLVDDGIDLVLAGRDVAGYSQALRRLAVDLGLGRSVVFVGVVDDPSLRALYAGAQAIVVPSVREGFGLVAVEAMGAGTPVLAADSGSLPEVLEGAGLLFDPAEPGGLTRCLRQVAQEPDLRARLAALGLERSRHFSWDATAQGTARVYEDATSTTQP